MKPTIIAISGKKKAGKDALCQALIKLADVKCARVGFADALKREVAEACGVHIGVIELQKDRFRPILQWWGTDFKRWMYGTDYWVEKLCETVDHEFMSKTELVIVPDTRFLSEVEFLVDAEATIIRISRPTSDNTDTHPSETELDSYDKFDDIVLNTGTLSDLENEARLLLTKYNIPIKQTT